MKRLLCICLAFVFLLVGCATPQKTDGVFVVTTNFPAYDFARQILGDQGHVELLIPLGGEAHGYEPTLQDLAAVQNCDLIVYNGGESDGFMQSLLAECDRSEKTVIRMMDCVELLEVGETDHHHHHHEHDLNEADEHVWTTPQNGLAIAKQIARGLQQADPENRGVYEENFARLQQELQQLCTDYECLSAATHKPLLVADRFPFVYLTNQYDLDWQAAFSGCTSKAEADLPTVSRLITHGKQQGVSVVLCTEFSDGVLAKTVADGMGAKTAVWHSCHNVTAEDFEAGVTYGDLMNRNLLVLKEALGL